MTQEYEVKAEDVNSRLDKLLCILEPNYARHQIQQWIKDEYVQVGERQVKANYKCKIGDRIEWSIPEEKPMIIEPEAIPLDILYEDDYIIVINKQRGILIHPTKQIHTNTLVNALMHHCSTLSTLSGEDRPGIVHRLDRDTSGVLIVAKDDKTHAHLQNQFKQQTVTRVYEAIVNGVVGPNKGVIKAPIGRHATHRLRRAVVADGKEAETQFDVMKRFDEHTHMQCKLITGRTHQIRVHLTYMNHPIVGDTLYYPKQTELVEGQALFAKELHIIHPYTNEEMIFKVDQPSYFTDLLEKLKRMS